MRDFFDGWGEDLGDGGRCRRVRGSGSTACFFRRGGSADGFVHGNGSGRGHFWSEVLLCLDSEAEPGIGIDNRRSGRRG